MSRASKRKRTLSAQSGAPTGSASTAAAAPAARGRTARRRSVAASSPLVRYRSAILAAVAGIGILIVAFVVLQPPGKTYECNSLLTPPAQASADPNALGFVTADMGRQHVIPPGTPIDYDFCPPTSGGHYAAADRGPIRNAVYPASSEQAPGGWVHNLEHGAVVVLYRCPSGALGTGDCATAQDMAQMQQWFNTAPAVNNCPKQAIVARFDEISTPFAVLAWDRALLMDSFDLEQATAFAQQWTDVTAPEAERLICS